MTADLVTGLATEPDRRTPAQAAAVALSDTLIAEAEAAEVIVIGAPMYTFSIPSTLKAWLDHVVRAQRTIRYTPEGQLEGLLTGKRVFVVASRGGIYSEGPRRASPWQHSYSHPHPQVQGTSAQGQAAPQVQLQPQEQPRGFSVVSVIVVLRFGAVGAGCPASFIVAFIPAHARPREPLHLQRRSLTRQTHNAPMLQG